MITNFFITLIYMASVSYSLMPNWKIPNEYIEPIDTVMAYVLSFHGIINVIAILEGISLVFWVSIGLWSLRIMLSLFNYIRGSGSMRI